MVLPAEDVPEGRGQKFRLFGAQELDLVVKGSILVADEWSQTIPFLVSEILGGVWEWRMKGFTAGMELIVLMSQLTKSCWVLH